MNRNFWKKSKRSSKLYGNLLARGVTRARFLWGDRMLNLVLAKAGNGSLTKDLHFFTFDDLQIILDVNSGSISIADDVTRRVLEALAVSKGNESDFYRRVSDLAQEEIQEVVGELAETYQEGALLAADKYEAYADFTAEPVLKSLCLHVSHDCNLRCRYCFAGTGNFGGARVDMPLEVGQQALNFLLEKSGDRKYCEVDFFGGEPLLNFQVIEELVSYGKKQAEKAGKEFRFTLTTNGVLLNKRVREFLNKEGISVVLSLDGRQRINDYMRPFPQGAGSYDLIVPKYKEFVDSRNGQDYYLRGTYTRKNLYFSKDVIHMFDLGFKTVSVEPVVASPEEDYAFREDDKPIIAEEYRKLAREYLQRRKQGEDIRFFHFNVDLDGGPCLPKRLTGCGAGYQYMAVTPDGELFPCHQFVGESAYSLGDVWNGAKNKALARKFAEAHIYNKECRECWARFLCSGGCHANAVHHSGDLNKPYSFGCFMQKVRLECAIYLYVQESLGGI